MLGFFFKKNFYEGWDNVMFFIVPNLIFDAVALVLGIGAFFVTKLPESASLFGVIAWAVAAFLFCFFTSLFSLSWAEVASDIVNYGVPEIKDFFTKLKSCLKDALLFGTLIFFVLLVTVFGAIYYFTPQFKATVPSENGKSFIGLLAGFVFCWIALTIFMGLSWYPALRSFMHDPFKKSIKKCFILLFDNLFVSIVIGLYNIFLFLISIVMLGVAPGLAGLGLSRENALYLLLKKYDYIEELDNQNEPQNSPKRRRIPWMEILSSDIENTGTKGFKGFFMPWKELEEQGAKNASKKKNVEVEEDEKWREEGE